MVATVLSFDFDGTLHDPAESPPVPLAFFDRIRQLHRDHAVVWGINTGRSLAQMKEGFVESSFPFLPDWVVVREHEIYSPGTNGDWVPWTEWNRQAEREIHQLFKHARGLLEEIRHQVGEHTGAQWIEVPGEPAGLVARTEEEMAWIAAKVMELAAIEPKLGWQRNSIWLRFGHRDYQKGSALSEICRHYSLGAPRCFAIGDSHNDLEMLAAEHSGMCACPANAVPDIRALVASRGGYQSRAVHGAGAVEALDHFFPPPEGA